MIFNQIGAVASPQSQTIPNREYLDKIESEIKEKLGPDGVVPLPNWYGFVIYLKNFSYMSFLTRRPHFFRGGYLIKPHLFEFWQGQTNRLHDRIIFRHPKPDDNKELVHDGENGWVFERLAP